MFVAENAILLRSGISFLSLEACRAEPRKVRRNPCNRTDTNYGSMEKPMQTLEILHEIMILSAKGVPRKPFFERANLTFLT